MDPAALVAACADPCVVAVQAANHEVGTRQRLPGGELSEQAAVFVDACAAMGRDPLPPRWDAAAGSSHKWGGPAGVGVLLVRHGAAWASAFPDDDRADHRGVGYENVLDPRNGVVLRVGVQDRFDSDPGNAKRNDVTYFMTLGVKF